MVRLSGVAIVAGGLSVAPGTWADLVALFLAAFALSILPILHDFWKEEYAQAQQMQMAQFVKNVAMAGGALVSSTSTTSSKARPAFRSPTRCSAVPTDARCYGSRLEAPPGLFCRSG